MDYVYRCNRCGKIVFRYQISYGSHRCRKCGSRRMEPILDDLTWFGKLYCKFVNKIGESYYGKKNPESIAY